MVEPDLPQRIGSYEVLERLGVGGMAEVFLGRAAAAGGFEKLVALKRVLPHLAASSTFVEMFLDEARIAAKLNHSNIVQIFDLGRTDDSYFIAMEYVPGLSVRDLLVHCVEQARRVSGPLAAFIVMQVCMALEHAHSATDSGGVSLNIVHRDVSPTNVLISFEGDVKLIDFGIAKASQRLHQTQAGQLKGKFGYIAPELLRGEKPDARSDIFAAGVVLYCLLSNTNPFYQDEATLTGDRLPPPSRFASDVPPELEGICMRAVDVDPAQRYPRAGTMGAALEEYWHRHPFTRLQLAAWMKSTFRPSFERQMRLAGVAVPEPTLVRGVDPPASDQRTIERFAAAADAPASDQRTIERFAPDVETALSAQRAVERVTPDVETVLSDRRTAERTPEAPTSALGQPDRPSDEGQPRRRRWLVGLLPLAVLVGLGSAVLRWVGEPDALPFAAAPDGRVPRAAPLAIPISVDAATPAATPAPPDAQPAPLTAAPPAISPPVRRPRAKARAAVRPRRRAAPRPIPPPAPEKKDAPSDQPRLPYTEI